MNKLTTITLSSCLTGMALVSGIAQAQTKIGIIDIREIVTQSEEVKTISENIAKDFKSREEKIVSLEKQLQADLEKLERDKAVMAANEQAKLEKEASENQAQLQQLQAEFRRDTSVRQQADMEQYFNKVKESMQEVAKNDDYDLVLSRDVVPYAKEEIDMTQAVIANLNKQKN